MGVVLSEPAIVPDFFVHGIDRIDVVYGLMCFTMYAKINGIMTSEASVRVPKMRLIMAPEDVRRISLQAALAATDFEAMDEAVMH